MSEKRRRQQQRRQRRKAMGRARSATPGLRHAAAGGAAAAGRHDAERELTELVTAMAEISTRDADDLRDSLEAEQWASSLIGTWHARPMPGQDIEAVFFPGFVGALETLRSAPALATLRALGAVAAGVHGQGARAAADRLAARGLAEPPWHDALGKARPTAAALMHDEAFDDGVSVLLEFTAPDSGVHTLGIYIDHNLGGLIKDVFLAGPLSEVRAMLERASGKDGLAMRELDFGEARARIEAGMYMLDHTLDPPVSDDVRPLRALIEARLSLLPEGFTLPDELEEMGPDERDELLADFLVSPEGSRWRDDEDAEDVARLAIDFGADYNHGGPLRWSPVVVEIFMTSWLARKVVREPELFARVPDILRDWVAFAGRRWGVPATGRSEAVAAVELYREEMLEVTGDQEAWGPAKAFAVAAQQAGVDLSDPDALGRFVEHFNTGPAA